MNIRVIVTTQDAETEVTMSSPTQFSLLRLGKIGQVRFVRDQARSVLTPLLLVMANTIGIYNQSTPAMGSQCTRLDACIMMDDPPWASGPLGSHNVPALSLGSWRSLLADTMYPPWLQLWPWRSLTALIKSW